MRIEATGPTALNTSNNLASVTAEAKSPTYKDALFEVKPGCMLAATPGWPWPPCINIWPDAAGVAGVPD